MSSNPQATAEQYGSVLLADQSDIEAEYRRMQEIGENLEYR
ncbi:hypothetical protein [Haloarcula laminariae]|nr:hypothetical protein [Halomicroarcula laminariae]